MIYKDVSSLWKSIVTSDNIENYEESLISKLIEFDSHYEKGHPIISDRIYDDFKDLVKRHFPNNRYFLSVGHTPHKNKIKLPYILGSLNKYNPSTVENWLQKYIDFGGSIVVMEKLDGSSICVVYEAGKPVMVSTRGDGKVGILITENMRDVLSEISYKKRLVVRGEAILTGDSHKKLGYKNRRNGIAGILNKDVLNSDEKSLIRVVFHGVMEPELTYIDSINLLESLNLSVPKYRILTCDNTIVNKLNSILMLYKSNTDYDIDGLVITGPDFHRENAEYPSNIVAYKVNQEAIRTTVVDIEWSVGRTGRIVPIVIVEPVNIGGTTVKRATGFNAKFIMDNDIKPGSVVGIYKAGDIIPYIDFIE